MPKSLKIIPNDLGGKAHVSTVQQLFKQI